MYTTLKVASSQKKVAVEVAMLMALIVSRMWWSFYIFSFFYGGASTWWGIKNYAIMFRISRKQYCSVEKL